LNGNVCNFLEYKGQLAMITKDNQPTWFVLSPGKDNPTCFEWKRQIIRLNATVICAACYKDDVYMLSKFNTFIEIVRQINYKYFFFSILTAFNELRNIILYYYCPVNNVCQMLSTFNIIYDKDTTMCAFNADKVMVFNNYTFEYYSFENYSLIEYKIKLNSFISKYLFSVPIYENKTY